MIRSIKPWIPAATAILMFMIGSAHAQTNSEASLGQRINHLIDEVAGHDADKRVAAAKALADLPPEARPILEKIDTGYMSEFGKRAIRRALIAMHNRPLREAMLAERQKEVATLVDLFIRYYTSSAYHNPKWDDHVQAYYRINRTMNELSPKQVNDAAGKEIDQALAAGCKDPVMQWMGVMFHDKADPADPQKVAERMQSLLKQLFETPEPGFARIEMSHGYLIFLERFRTRLTLDIQAERRRVYADCIGILKEAIQELPHNNSDVWKMVVDVYDMSSAAGRIGDGFTQITAILRQVNPESCWTPLLQSLHDSRIDPKWAPGDSAGMEMATRQTESAHARMRKNAALAYQRNHSSTLAAAHMMAVVEDPAEFDLWFHRATDENPDNYQAMLVKYNWLSQNGDMDLLHTYARECADHDLPTKNIVLFMLNYHYLVGTDNGAPKAGYFQDPQVFEEIQDVLIRYLEASPGDLARRCLYARYAMWAERWDIANAQFNILGDRFDPIIFGGRQEFNYAKAKARRMAAAASQPAMHAAP